MKSVQAAATLIAIVIAGCTGNRGSAGEPDHWNQGTTMTMDMAKSLSLGMTFQEVEARFPNAERIEGSIPVVLYEAADGGNFMLVFFKLGSIPPSEAGGLTAIGHIPAGSDVGSFVVPRERRGERFDPWDPSVIRLTE